jgi:hypothetical protein
MKISNSELQDSGGDNNHPVGDFTAVVKACTGELKEDKGTEVRVTFGTEVGQITQFWNTSNLAWKIKIFRDALGLSGDFDLDDAVGKKLDIKVTKKVSDKNGKTYTNLETHPEGSLVSADATPPMASATAADTPF